MSRSPEASVSKTEPLITIEKLLRSTQETLKCGLTTPMMIEEHVTVLVAGHGATLYMSSLPVHNLNKVNSYHSVPVAVSIFWPTFGRRDSMPMSNLSSSAPVAL